MGELSALNYTAAVTSFSPCTGKVQQGKHALLMPKHVELLWCMHLFGHAMSHPTIHTGPLIAFMAVALTLGMVLRIYLCATDEAHGGQPVSMGVERLMCSLDQGGVV